jgi:hypothetical protein
VLAESEDTIRLESDHHFPSDSRSAEFSDLMVDGAVNRDAALCHLDPSAGRVAFWRGVRVEKVRVGGPAVPGEVRPGMPARLRARLRSAG